MLTETRASRSTKRSAGRRQPVYRGGIYPSHRLGPAALVVLALIVALWVGIATSVTAQDVRFDVSGFKVDGPNPLDSERVEELLAPYYGEHTDLERLQDAAATLENAIRDLGYAFYRVNLPPQTLSSSVVTLQVIAFAVESITVEGNEYFADDNVLRSLPQLRTEQSPNVQKLSRQLTIANEHPAKRVETRFAVNPTTGGLNARVRVRDVHPMSAFTWLDNTGTERTGDLRLGFGIQHSNVFHRDHIVTATATTSPTHISDVRQFGLDYRMPIYSRHSQLSFVAADSTVNSGQVADAFDVRGSGNVFGSRYRYILPKRNKLQHSVIVSVFDKHFDNDIRFEQQPVGNAVRSRPLAIQYQGILALRDASLSMNVGVSSNLGGGRNNNDEAYDMVRRGATPDWTVVRVGSSFAKSISDWAVNARIEGQFTGDALIPGEQFAIGGVRTMRGFDESELSNDEGVRLGVELWSPQVRPGLRGIAFLDYGRVWRNDALADEVTRDSVASLGVGLRYALNPRLRANFDIGYVLDGIDSPETDLTEDGDIKIHFNLTYRFAKLK